jgi:hypothetical protein
MVARGRAEGESDDDRWIVVDGRRWRATDPSIPEAFRVELVHELMDARREIGAAKHRGADPTVLRRRVDDAKVALGERGEAWWLAPTSAGRRRRIEATIRTLLRARPPTSSICPSDVARTVGGAQWRSLMPDVRQVAADLVADGTVVVTQRGDTVDVTAARGPVRIRRGTGLLPDAASAPDG